MKNCTNCYWGIKDRKNPGEYLCLAIDGQHALIISDPYWEKEPCKEYEENNEEGK
jgi:hypothetical protein